MPVPISGLPDGADAAGVEFPGSDGATTRRYTAEEITQGGGAVLKSDFDQSHSLLTQQSGTGSPETLSVPANRLVGRLSGGGSAVAALTASEARGLLDYPASEVSFDPTGTPLVSTDAQAAITEAAEYQIGGTRSYGTVAIVLPARQINAAVMEQSAIDAGGNVELFRDFGTYSRCQVTLRWAPEDGSGPYTREVTQTFADQASLVAYVDANTTRLIDGTSAEYVTMEIFDIEDSFIVPPAKVYGQNRAYATMVRQSPLGRYHGHKTGSAAHTAGRAFSTPIATALKRIWDALGYPNVLPPPASWGTDEFSLFWLSRNRMRRYDMPQFSPASLQIPGEVGEDRKVYNATTGTITDRASVGFATGYNPGAAEKVSYASINSVGSVTGINFVDSWRGLGVALGSGGSVLVGYPLIREFAPGEFEYSVFIKPVGVDTFAFEAFDPARYRLEAVGVLRNDFRPKLRPLTLSQPNGTEQAGARTAGFITSGAIAQALGLQPNRFQQAYAGSHGYRSGSVRFQYRDLVTGRVSGLSSAAIKPVWRQRARPFALMVRNQIT